jgi:O-antigen ligase
MALLLVVLVTAALAPNPLIASIRTVIWLIHVAFAWSIFRMCSSARVRPRDLTNGLIIGFVIATAAFVIFVLTIPNFETFDWKNGLPGYDNIRRIAYYTAPIMGLCFARLSLARRIPAWMASFAVSTVGFTLVFWTGARGALVALVAAYIVGAVLFPRLRGLRVWSGTIVASILGAFLAHLYASPFVWMMGMGRMLSGSSSGRTDLWQSTIETIAMRPLLGYGEGQTSYVVPLGKEFGVFHPHNILLQTLLAWGIVGTVLLVIIAAPMAVRMVRATRRVGGEFLPPFMAMLVLFLYSAIDGTLFHVLAVSLFATCAGAVSSGIYNGRAANAATTRN